MLMHEKTYDPYIIIPHLEFPYTIPIDLKVTFSTIAWRVINQKNYHMHKTDVHTVLFF